MKERTYILWKFEKRVLIKLKNKLNVRIKLKKKITAKSKIRLIGWLRKEQNDTQRRQQCGIHGLKYGKREPFSVLCPFLILLEL